MIPTYPLKVARELDRAWAVAESASWHRYRTAKALGCESEQAKSAWVREEAAWAAAWQAIRDARRRYTA